MRKTIIALACVALAGCYRVEDARIEGQANLVSIRHDVVSGKTHYLGRDDKGNVAWLPVLSPK